MTKGPTRAKVVVADNPAELDAKTRDAETHDHPPPLLHDPAHTPPRDEVTIHDYAPGQRLETQRPATTDPDLGSQRPPPVTDPNPDLEVATGSPHASASPLHSTPESLRALNELRANVHSQQRSGQAHKIPSLPGPGMTRYESRIRIAEAWQYNGELASAPAWIDRSWAAWDDGDGQRPQGPALRVPTASSQTGDRLCRRGDYIVRQEVTLMLGVEPDMQIEVWSKDEFERFFLPQRPGGPPPIALMTGNTPANEEPASADAAQQP